MTTIIALPSHQGEAKIAVDRKIAVLGLNDDRFTRYGEKYYINENKTLAFVWTGGSASSSNFHEVSESVRYVMRDIGEERLGIGNDPKSKRAMQASTYLRGIKFCGFALYRDKIGCFTDGKYSSLDSHLAMGTGAFSAMAMLLYTQDLDEVARCIFEFDLNSGSETGKLDIITQSMLTGKEEDDLVDQK